MHSHPSQDHGLAGAASSASASIANSSQEGLKRKAVVTSVPEPSEPDVSEPVKTASNPVENPLFKGRKNGTTELKLRAKLNIVKWAESENMIKWNANTASYKKIASQRTVDTLDFGDVKKRKVDQIRDWGNDAVRHKWEEFSGSVDMQNMYSNQDPLTLFCRIPDAWFNVICAPSERPQKKGRPAIKDRYPRDMASLQEELVRLYNEHRNAAKGGATWSMQMDRLFQLWNNLLQAHNKEARQINNPEIKKEIKGERRRRNVCWGAGCQNHVGRGFRVAKWQFF